jgi:hypothetical protein
MRALPVITPLDRAWAEINALGGVPTTDADCAYCAGIEAALAVIERLGGRDPVQVRAAAVITASKRAA